MSSDSVTRMPTARALRSSLLEASRRYSRLAHEAEDLAHDLLVSALQRGLELDDEALLRSAGGAARRHGAFLARTAARRRIREERAAMLEPEEMPDLAHDDLEPTPLSTLTPTLRTTLLLLALGLDKAELRATLGLDDAALRKRFQALRERAPLEKPELRLPFRTPTLHRLRRSQLRLLAQLARRRSSGRRAPRLLAIGDPDGHGIILSEALTSGPCAATTGTSSLDAET